MLESLLRESFEMVDVDKFLYMVGQLTSKVAELKPFYLDAPACGALVLKVSTHAFACAPKIDIVSDAQIERDVVDDIVGQVRQRGWHGLGALSHRRAAEGMGLQDVSVEEGLLSICIGSPAPWTLRCWAQ